MCRREKGGGLEGNERENQQKGDGTKKDFGQETGLNCRGEEFIKEKNTRSGIGGIGSGGR